MEQSKYWCFTDYQELPTQFNSSKMTYLICGRETCPTTGRLHWQCYIELPKSQRLKYMQKLIGYAHFEQRKGTAEQARDYCMKEDKNPLVSGKLSYAVAGRSGGLSAVAAELADGQRLIDVAKAHPVAYIKYNRGIEKLAGLYPPKNSWRTLNVEIHWGDSGTGKTRYAYKRYPELYSFEYSADREWWDGYNGENAILFDEFSGQIPLANMLKYLDGHPKKLWIKGGSTHAEWTTVILTSNVDPDQWYRGADPKQLKALLRRVSLVKKYSDGESPPTPPPSEEEDDDAYIMSLMQ